LWFLHVFFKFIKRRKLIEQAAGFFFLNAPGITAQMQRKEASREILNSHHTFKKRIKQTGLVR